MSNWWPITLVLLIIGGCICTSEYIQSKENIEMHKLGYVRNPNFFSGTEWVKP